MHSTQLENTLVQPVKPRIETKEAIFGLALNTHPIHPFNRPFYSSVLTCFDTNLIAFLMQIMLL